MVESRRQKRVGSLLKEVLSKLLIEDIQDASSGLITVTRVEMSKDLRVAHVYISLYGCESSKFTLDFLERRKKHIRKTVASKIKLKYNPELIFSLDSALLHEERIDRLLEEIKRDER